MQWLIITILLLCSALNGWSSTMKNACLANLMQINGAVQLWALENGLTDTNSYSLRDTNVTQYMPRGKLPECPAGGVYVAGRTVDDSPRCTLHGSLNNQDYWRNLQIDLDNSLFGAHMAMALAAFFIGLFIFAFFSKAVNENKILLVQARMIQPAILFGAAILVSLTRFLWAEEYRWPIFLCAPMLVFAAIGFLIAIVGARHSKGRLQGYFVLMSLLNFMPFAPILFSILFEGFHSKIRI